MFDHVPRWQLVVMLVLAVLALVALAGGGVLVLLGLLGGPA